MGNHMVHWVLIMTHINRDLEKGLACALLAALDKNCEGLISLHKSVLRCPNGPCVYNNGKDTWKSVNRWPKISLLKTRFRFSHLINCTQVIFIAMANHKEILSHAILGRNSSVWKTQATVLCCCKQLNFYSVAICKVMSETDPFTIQIP